MMVKCKDCIHSEVCDQSSRMMWTAMAGKTECEDFKDRSRYVVREKGEWKKEGPYTSVGGEYKKALICPKCFSYFVSDGNTPWQLHNFCPNCGADMRTAKEGA